MSKILNRIKPIAHQNNELGVKVSTNIMATISSHTMLEWSSTPIALPVLPQIEMPIKKKREYDETF